MENPIKLLLFKDNLKNETIVQFSQSLYDKIFKEIVIFLENDQNMILRLDLTTNVNLARATFLWGPDGSWGSEQHSFNSSDETYLGGAYSSNITNNMWSGELYLPWDFLPHNLTNIQVKSFSFNFFYFVISEDRNSCQGHNFAYALSIKPYFFRYIRLNEIFSSH